MSQLLRLGIAGLGNAGQAVLRDLSVVSEITLGAVADVRAEALEACRAKNPLVEVHVSVEAMCQSNAVDAVWIATPNEFHAAHAVAAANGGKHVVCEKPMALSLLECDRMIEAAAKNRVQLLMHSKAGDPPIRKMREVINSGRLGRPIQINSWNYKSWLNYPRLPAELDSTKGGGVVFRQGSHQVDIVRCIGGGLIKSVRAATGRWHPRFDTEGNYTAFLEFADGTPATLVFNGYGGFDMTELTWGIGEGGYSSLERSAKAVSVAGPVSAVAKYAEPSRAERRRRDGARRQPFFGLTLVSCERGDIRQSPDGLYLYTDQGREEITCVPFMDRAGELRRLYEAATQGRPEFADGKWGKATLEALLAIIQSSKERREVALEHQVPCTL
ncbi:MAG TPA: Gfo/Idh/MocA family oxidoreductase [Candidatus Limnocylindrales bacterium]|nr:Gfo/Idh/MocA family oxidoreductase [Candidatus Limnocylindrales bacterium]